VTIDSKPYESMSDPERGKIEADAIRRILEIVPAENRSEATALLQGHVEPEALGLRGGAIGVAVFHGSSNLEVARLLGVIASVRAAGAEKIAAAAVKASADTKQHDPRDRIFVTVVYDETLAEPAVALFNPGYQLPILIVGRDASPDDLRSGLRVAAQLARDFGPRPKREYRAGVERAREGEGVTESTKRLLASIRSSPAREIPGIGRVPAVEVVTYPRR
jgi:hypothetical protein